MTQIDCRTILEPEENFMINRIKDRLSGAEGKRSDTIDNINARIFEENKDRALADTLAEFEANLEKKKSKITVAGEFEIDVRSHLLTLRDKLKNYVCKRGLIWENVLLVSALHLINISSVHEKEVAEIMFLHGKLMLQKLVDGGLV